MSTPEDKSKRLRDQSLEGLKQLDDFMEQTAEGVSPESSDEVKEFNKKLGAAVRQNMERRIGQILPAADELPQSPELPTSQFTRPPNQLPQSPRGGRRFIPPSQRHP